MGGTSGTLRESNGGHMSEPTESNRTWYWNRHLVDEFIVAAYKLQHAKSDQELLIFSHS